MATADSRIRSYRDLVVWQKSMDLVEQVYQLSNKFPSNEDYRLTQQLTRAAVSVPANIAEGHGRGSTRDYANFLSIARGSVNETETLLLISVRLRYLDEPSVRPALDLLTEISKMLRGLRARLQSNPTTT